MGELDGKVAVVTGAASGIGEATARAFAAAGANVVVTAQHEEKAKPVADSIAERAARRWRSASTRRTRSRSPRGCRRSSAVRRDRHPPQQRGDHERGVHDARRVDPRARRRLWDQTMAVNLRGYMLCAKHAIRTCSAAAAA